jgi:hypothetical protein
MTRPEADMEPITQLEAEVIQRLPGELGIDFCRYRVVILRYDLCLNWWFS